MACINTNLPEYQTLKNKSGIQEPLLLSICRYYVENYGRFPYLDEIPNSNSEPHLIKDLGIKSNGGVLIDNVLEKTGKETVTEATIELNNSYRDLEISVTPIVKEAIVEVQHRPTTTNFDTHKVDVDTDINSYEVFNNALLKLANLYGINFNTITDLELNTLEWLQVSPYVSNANAFVYNGEIYVNIDRCSVEDPLHEIMHILVGSMRFSDPNLYQLIVSSVELFENYDVLSTKYPNRSRNDVNEEIFITETAKYLMGLESSISNFDDKVKHEIEYNAKRVLDTILMGLDSVKTLDGTLLYTSSFKALAKVVNSETFNNKFKGYLNTENSELHRKLNNMKSDLIKNNQLLEICN